MSNPGFALGDAQYSNDLNPLSGRYQTVHTSGWSAATDVTTGTAGTTEILFPAFPMELGELLDVLIQYPAASGAITTPAQLSLWKYIANSATAVQLATNITGAVTPVPFSAFTEASQPIRTCRRFSAASFVPATFQASQVGANAYQYPVLNAGEVVRLRLDTLGIAGTQSVLFAYIFRERPVTPTGPSLTTTGTTTTFG